MNRALTFFIGPESLLGLLTAMVFAFCARHNSYESDDVHALERLVWLLPLIAVPLAFATIRVPGAVTWSWMVRANLALIVALAVCSIRVVNGFGAPGSGPKGQDAGFILVMTFGIGFSALANAITGAMILRHQRPSIAEWFHQHAIGGTLLTALASLPILVVQLVGVGVLAALCGAVMAVFKA